jgi:hypothetical protein
VKVDLALVGVIEGSHDPESSRKYRIALRLLGQSREGIVFNYISPFVDKGKIESAVRDSARKIADKLGTWEKAHPRKNEEVVSEKDAADIHRTIPNAGLTSVFPFGRFNTLAKNGFGIRVGADYTYRELSVFRPAQVIICPSLSVMKFSPNRSVVNSLFFYTATAGGGLKYDFSPFAVTPTVGAGYLLGVMKSSESGASPKTKYYHEPIFYLSSECEYRISRISISVTPAYNVFIDKNNIGQSVGLSFGVRYAL